MLNKEVIFFSGGQTGADRAALDFAIKNKMKHGGWCPLGRRAEDGVLRDIYKLQETPSDNYEERTEWNVRDSDGTVVFSLIKEIEGGTLFTLECAQKIQKPCLHIYQDKTLQPHKKLMDFINSHKIIKLNVAGPRASKEPGIYSFVWDVLAGVFCD